MVNEQTMNLKLYKEAKEWLAYYESHEKEVLDVYERLGKSLRKNLNALTKGMNE